MPATQTPPVPRKGTGKKQKKGKGSGSSASPTRSTIAHKPRAKKPTAKRKPKPSPTRAGGGSPPDEPTVPLRSQNGNGSDPQKVVHTTDWKPLAIIIGVATLALAALAFVGVVAYNTIDDDGSGTAPSGGNTKEEQSALEAVQDKYEDYDRSDYNALAKQQDDCTKNDQFVSGRLEGKSPAEKLDILLQCAAKDQVSLVGLTQTTNPGAFNSRTLGAVVVSDGGDKLSWKAWRGLRDAWTGSANIYDTKLNGSGFTTFVTSSGKVGVSADSWKNQDAIGIDLASRNVNGKQFSAKSIKMENPCGNVAKEGKQPPVTVPPPPQPPNPPDEGKDVRPLDNSVTGTDPHTDAEKEFQPAPAGSVPGTSQGGDQGHDSGQGPGVGPAPGSDSTGATNPGCPSCAPTDTGQGADGDSGGFD